jgi:UDP-glucose 4-epimerase
VLRTSRFFPERDDNPDLRTEFDPANAQANELLYRRADIEDMVSAHLCAIERAPALGFGATSCRPRRHSRARTCPSSAATRRAVVERLFPECAALYAARGWKLFGRLDRVYVNERARSI